MVISKFKNRRSFEKFIKDLAAMEPVERTNSHVILTTLKEDFRVPV